MKNKTLQILLARYPDDMEVNVSCHNYHFGNAYTYELTSVDSVKRTYQMSFGDVEKFDYYECIHLNGRAE